MSFAKTRGPYPLRNPLLTYALSMLSVKPKQRGKKKMSGIFNKSS